jgi:hypothetical protein
MQGRVSFRHNDRAEFDPRTQAAQSCNLKFFFVMVEAPDVCTSNSLKLYNPHASTL